ncbi:shikimate dehydrogenase [Chromohalobacter marismortui]|uniref:Shikimate dehydrogenase (NADP(+)) n=1 Tax=Chromohalobacter marismortui TaxID=42055 RepID=A0A4R7NG15_9GAMM|nr:MULTISPECIES: shikimate dehydrogenase [Chromohalobacter]MCI0509378.1 shikimate dehydrogenase [Chromohalobacter sp.]MCI0592998.1 shikimate dehydrogenase [Chromohalobacter sp.]TDU19249.1 shikimate dehydrogenase [Chromohalobacter marismortui]
MSDRYCVFGHPIAHSRSPRIHALFAEQCGQAMTYEAIEAPREDFAGAWHAFMAAGGCGANVTVPFKEEAYRVADVLSQRARRAGAVNTLVHGRDGRTYADTTDGVGLVRDLEWHGVALYDARILVLGAGGAVRGVLDPLLAAGPRALHIANRTAEKAVGLAADVHAQERGQQASVTGGGYDALEGAYDVVINGTSASLAGDLPPLPDTLLADTGVAYDMMYAADQTVFLQWAGARGARTIDGLGMLIEQAAEAFFLWRQVRPDTGPVRDTLRHEL